MRFFWGGAVFIAGMVISISVWAGLFSSAPCDYGSSERKPEWVDNPGYTLPGFQVGVGAAAKEGKSRDEQRTFSENEAKKHLVEHIQVTIKAENEQSTRVSNQSVLKEASSKVTVSAEEDLRGLKQQGYWVDKESCMYYSLMVISDESLKQAKHEKTMRFLLGKFKERLEAGADEDKNRDIIVRQQYLEEARALLSDIDFTALSASEHGMKAIYTKRLEEVLSLVNSETSKAKVSMAIFVLNKDGTLNADVLGRMTDQVQSTDKSTARLMEGCSLEQDCISLAKSHGYTRLTLLNASSQVVTSQMGSLKGTLTVTKTVFDIKTGKKIQDTEKASTQVIGWAREELDWGTAAEKAMQSLK